MNIKLPPIILGLLVLVSACATGDQAFETEGTLPDPQVRVLEQEEGAQIQVTSNPTPPASTQQYPGYKMLFGLESHQADFGEHEDLVGAPGMTLMRHNGLLWHKIEPEEGERDWTAAAGLEQVLVNASASGLETILIVRGTPAWAQLVPGARCGPILPEKLHSFADFLGEAVSRYSQPPFNIKYWELGNEPDVDPQLVGSDSVFGCWGNHQDANYGGGYYAEMLKTVYPAIKNADPEAKVLIGGLLLDCDPHHPREGKDCSPGNFLEGVLQNGGGNYFDIVSFHGYAPYFGPESGLPYELYVDVHHPSWEHLGGVVEGKIDFIRQVMGKYQLDKPIFHTEGALMCPENNLVDCNPPGESFLNAQAAYAVRMYLRNWADGVQGTIWFQFEGPGWRHGGLLDEDQARKPVYDALVYLTHTLSPMDYLGVVTQYESLQGYEFGSLDKKIWVLWSLEQVDTPIQVPEDTTSIHDKFGNEIAIPEGELVVNDPLYLQFAP